MCASLEVLEAREWSDIECIAADALDPASLETALTGNHIAFYLVHSMGAGARFGALDITAAENFAAAAASAGVSHILYLGGLVPEGASKRLPIILPVPVLTPELSSYWLGLTTAVPANIARALIGGLRSDFYTDDDALRQRMPQYLLGTRDAIATALQAEVTMQPSPIEQRAPSPCVAFGTMWRSTPSAHRAVSRQTHLSLRLAAKEPRRGTTTQGSRSEPRSAAIALLSLSRSFSPWSTRPRVTHPARG